MTTLICNCNRTIPLEQKQLSKVLGESPTIHQGLCRHEIGKFIQTLNSPEEISVACTQEQALFLEIAGQSEKPLVAPLRFFNIRELAGWGRSGHQAQAKINALIALSKLPLPEPLPTVSYDSTRRRVLIIGTSDYASEIAQQLSEDFQVTLLTHASDANMPIRSYVRISGQIASVQGYLGNFQATWTVQNPIQLDLCTGCGACIDACPEQAIDESFQIQMDRCRDHRSCVNACGSIGAIQFHQVGAKVSEEFDFILDLYETPFLTMPEPPQGYFVAGSQITPIYQTIQKLQRAVGEFEKPRFFKYQEKLCAHGRNGQQGCTACIDSCSTQAISSSFDSGKGKVVVNPHLCMGCGACATACPSGAMTYNNPSVDYLGLQISTILSAFQDFKKTPSILFHSGTSGGQAILEKLGQKAKLLPEQIAGIPAHIVPLSLHHIASTGLELWLAALSHGVGEIILFASAEESPQYRQLLENQSALANQILQGLGYEPRVHLMQYSSLQELDTQLNQFPLRSSLVPPASFAISSDKRQNLEFALEYLIQHAPKPLIESQQIHLANTSPIGGVTIDADRCTLCMSCVGACPESAMLDHLQSPQLNFIEKNCVQCGLCVKTCPENALTLAPRLIPTSIRKQKVIIHEAKPFHCVKCAKPFTTEKMMASMLLKIGHHPAFQGIAQKRLQMCSDCRVIDMMQQ